MVGKTIFKKIFTLLFPALAFCSVNAGSRDKITDATINHIYSCEVKSVDEFISRFNGIETHPEIPDDSLSRISNLFALLNHQEIFKDMNSEKQIQLATEFCDSVINHNAEISLTDGSMIVECDAQFTFNNQPCRLNLLMQQTEGGKGYINWAITGVKGLNKILPSINDSIFMGLSPVEHEVYFMGLSDRLTKDGHCWSLIHPSRQVDPLSVFMSLVDRGILKFKQVKDEKIHCIGIPGFIFTVNESITQSNNSGWLIGHIQPATDNDKKEYITNLFN